MVKLIKERSAMHTEIIRIKRARLVVVLDKPDRNLKYEKGVIIGCRDLGHQRAFCHEYLPRSVLSQLFKKENHDLFLDNRRLHFIVGNVGLSRDGSQAI